jgi:hypothetical protein
MLLRYFNSDRIGITVIILLLPALFWVPDLWTGMLPNGTENAGTLPGRLIDYFIRNFNVVSRITALILILVNAFLLVLLNRIHNFIPVRTQLPAFFYVLLVACFNPVHQLTAALPASSLVILVLYRVITTYKSDGISYNFLDAGFLIALASLIYFPALFFFLMLLAGLILFRRFNWREWAYAFIGLGLPYLFLFSGYYLAGVPASAYFPGMHGLFSRNNQIFNLIQWLGWGFIVIMLGYGSYFMIATIDSMKIHGRIIFLFFLWLFVASVVIYAAIPGTGSEMLSFASVPVAFLFSHYFHKCKKDWINEVIFSLYLLLIILLRIL